jgi:hypothetical protein
MAHIIGLYMTGVPRDRATTGTYHVGAFGYSEVSCIRHSITPPSLWNRYVGLRTGLSCLISRRAGFKLATPQHMTTFAMPPPRRDESGWVAALFPNSGHARLWKVVAGVFLAAGILGLVGRVATISADMHARRTWPSADGEIVSANQTDDDANPSLKVSLHNRKRYWVEYEVRFAVPESQCRTGIIYTGASETMPCHGIIRTRSTQSTHRAYDWLIHGYHVNERVRALYNPNGPEVKIVGESIWLRYNTDWLLLNVVWVLAFFELYAFAQRRLAYFRSRPEAETVPGQPGSSADDRDRLTELDLS